MPNRDAPQILSPAGVGGDTPTPNLTRTLLRLDQAMRRNRLKDKRALAGIAILYLYGLGGMAWMAVRILTADSPLAAYSAAMALGTVAFWASSITYGSSSSSLNPAWFAPFPITPRQLWVPMWISGALSLPALIVPINTVISMIVTSVALVKHGTPGWIPLVIVTAILSAVITDLGAKAVILIIDVVAATGKTYIQVVFQIIVVFLVVAAIGLQTSLTATGDVEATASKFMGVIAVIRWLPIAAGPDSVAAFAAGQWVEGVIKLLISLATIAVLVKVWIVAFNQHIDNVVTRRAAVKTSMSAAILVKGMPHTVTGAVVSRVLRYCMRDNRMKAMLVMPFIVVVLQLGNKFIFENDTSSGSFTGLMMMIIAIASVVGNIFGIDGPANWVHMTSGVSPRTLVVGYATAFSLIQFGWVVVISALQLILEGPSVSTAVWIGGAIAVSWVSIGVSLIAATWKPYPVQRDMGSMLRQKGSTSMVSFANLFLTIIVLSVLVFSATTALEAITSRNNGSLSPVGIGISIYLAVLTVVAFFGGIALATSNVRSNWPTIFDKVKHFSD